MDETLLLVIPAAADRSRQKTGLCGQDSDGKRSGILSVHVTTATAAAGGGSARSVAVFFFFAKYLPVLFVTYIWEPTLTPRLHAIAVQLCRLVSVGKCNRHPSGQIQGYREVTLHDCDYGPILAPGYFCSSPCDTTQRQSHPSLKKKIKKNREEKYCSTIGR